MIVSVLSNDYKRAFIIATDYFLKNNRLCSYYIFTISC